MTVLMFKMTCFCELEGVSCKIRLNPVLEKTIFFQLQERRTHTSPHTDMHASTPLSIRLKYTCGKDELQDLNRCVVDDVVLP